MQRKLTVILSADVVGYSALMERDEAGTLERLQSNRREIFDPLVAAHGGRIFKLMGDGALVEFGSVVSAIQCAQEIQNATESIPHSNAANGIHYRIGINLGEVMIDGDDIYGDGVNVAARLQSLAPEGGVAASAIVREQISGRLAVDFVDLGEHTVRNLERPVRVFLLHRANTVESPTISSTATPAGPSLVVLPFANMSGDPEQEYFSDGITEDIITDLSKISALSVVSRNTSFTFKAKPIAVGAVARQLKVSHVLEGSVRKSGNRVRITAQLIEGSTDNHLWAERYDRDLQDIFALQDEISQAIVAALKLKLLPTEKRAIEKRSTHNAEAYKLYLMARQYNASGNSRHRPLTVRLCQRAVEIDPNYARAWALLAICQSNQRLLVDTTSDSGWEAALRALKLDPKLAEAHAAKGRVLADEGKYTEAWVEHEISLSLDANGYEVNCAAARCLMGMRRYAEAIPHLEKAASLIDSEFWAVGMSIQCYKAKGDMAGAKNAARLTLQQVERVIVSEPDHGLAIGWGVSALVALGERERAKEWAARALLLDPDNRNLIYNLGCSMAKLGDFDTALEYLERSSHNAEVENLAWMESDNELDEIREHPRYKEMIARAQARVAAREQ